MDHTSSDSSSDASSDAAANAVPASLIGAEYIRARLKELPLTPGVYQMFDAAGKALYVGKAKELRNRVTYYSRIDQLSPRLRVMVSKVTALEIILAQNEAEALLLEANLIKRLMPRYNILLRDDKSFPYILLAEDHPFPQIRKHRGGHSVKGRYFGPFASTGAASQTIALLQKAFLLRPCTDNVFKHRTRPCLQYQIKRCSGPCVGLIGEAEYRGLVDQAQDFLTGKSRQVQEHLATEMHAASAAMEYEKAGLLRDRIRALTQVQQEQALHAPTLEQADILALARRGGAVCLQVFFFRSGQNFGNQSFFPSASEESTEDEILTAFIGQFYQAHTPPKQLIVSHALGEAEVLEGALSLRAGGKVEVLHPQRGEKLQVIKQALHNAEESLIRHMQSRLSQQKHLQALGELFGLEQAPERIEVYDNSHIMGAHALGAMIVATPEGFDRKAYRQFNIKDITTEPGDDYAMMREMLTRRLRRLQEEDPERTLGQWPDLLLIDGGPGQLSVTTQVMEELGISDVPYATIAKGPDRNAGRETFFLPGRAPFQLPPGDALLHFLERLRDEAHRFAIGTHRNKRSKALRNSEINQIPGIGGVRKKALLLHFGSSRALANATVAELQKVPGISQKTAQMIYDYFHS